MRALLPAHITGRSGSALGTPRNLETPAPRNDGSFDFSKLDTPAPADANMASSRPAPTEPELVMLPQDEPISQRPPQPARTSLPQNYAVSSPVNANVHFHPTRASRTAHHQSITNDAFHRDLNLLEAHPTDDFEWDEQETLTNYSASPEAILETDGNGEVTADPIADGMASLAVSEKESGYLGVASGAALLRLLEPSTPRRRTQSSSSRTGQINHMQYSLAAQPDPNRHITDAMIDAYFRLYHISYPIIHEATFRAQYAGVIPRPSGDCWLVLAYTVAAIGVYTTATNLDNLDMSLFAQARSVLSFNFLEVGNLTLVQALTLISNYQQKRDKPNSGYNYLGLAVRMAMGLGLHKEFQGWNISPLNMEIRRRVWWSLCVFDVGATITFSRPSVWPYEGVEVSLPLNVDDRVRTVAFAVVVSCLFADLIIVSNGNLKVLPSRDRRYHPIHGGKNAGELPHRHDAHLHEGDIQAPAFAGRDASARPGPPRAMAGKRGSVLLRDRGSPAQVRPRPRRHELALQEPAHHHVPPIRHPPGPPGPRPTAGRLPRQRAGVREVPRRRKSHHRQHQRVLGTE